MTLARPSKRKLGRNPSDSTSSTESSFARLRRGGSRVLRLLSPKASRMALRDGTSLRRVVSTPEPLIKPQMIIRRPTAQATVHPLDSSLSSISPEVLQHDIDDLSIASYGHVKQPLSTIREVATPVPSIKDQSRPPTPAMITSVQTTMITTSTERLITSAALAEQVATTKIYFETLYESMRVEGKAVSPRSLRRKNMEESLSYICSTLDQQAQAREGFNKLESDHLRAVRCMKGRRNSAATGISLAGYEMVRVLGKGSFGIVSLVREKQLETAWPQIRRSDAVYAMKVIKKSEMLRQCQEAHLRIERDFLVKSAEKSKWMVPLVASFQDIDHLYLVMEFQIGGDFLNLLMTANGGIIGEDDTRFYVAEIIMCVEEAHNMRIIHRDVKPDNFLISASGHLKLADFGLAFDGHWCHKQSYFSGHRYAMMERLGADIAGDDEDRRLDSKSLPRPSLDGQLWYTASTSQSRDFETRHNRRKMARSIVGTSQYMAPEVIAGEHYDGRCDWWSVGIILFECLFGFTPFVRDDRQQTKQAIANFQQQFPWQVYLDGPQKVSQEVIDLIGHLLSVRQSRLCSQKYWNNDYRFDSKDTLQHTTDLDKGCYDYRGRFVYSNDADMLKQHPWFAGVNWRTIQHCRPPWKPACADVDSCQYFETEEEILKDHMSDTASFDDAVDLLELNMSCLDGEHKRKRLRQPPKRARDKLLRDPVVGKTVMQERKKGAFLGYTYRRPRTWSLGNEMRLSDPQMFWKDPGGTVHWPGVTEGQS